MKIEFIFSIVSLVYRLCVSGPFKRFRTSDNRPVQTISLFLISRAHLALFAVWPMSIFMIISLAMRLTMRLAMRPAVRLAMRLVIRILSKDSLTARVFLLDAPIDRTTIKGDLAFKGANTRRPLKLRTRRPHNGPIN